MGPFLNRIRNIIRKIILKKAMAIVVRDVFSAKYLEEQLGIRAYVALDSVFQDDVLGFNYILEVYSNGNGVKCLLEKLKKERVIGITISDLRWHVVYSQFPDLRNRIIESFTKVLMYLTNRGYQVLLIPHLFGERYEYAYQEFMQLTNFQKLNKEMIFILPKEMNSYVQQAIVSKLYCVISIRYHPIVYAAKANVPFIAIYYEHKQKGFVEMVGLEEFAIPIEEINANKLIKCFTLLERNYDLVKRHLEKKGPQLKQRSVMTIKVLRRLLEAKKLMEVNTDRNS